MNCEDYKSSLDKVYNKFWNCNGECKYYNECKKRLRNKTPKFRQDRVRVGKDYGEPNVPKILCVGIEGFIDECNLDENKILTKYLMPSSNAQNSHYNGVKYTLAYILSPFFDKEKPIPLVGNNICSNYDWTTSKYCLLNLYKCAFVPIDNPTKLRDLPHTIGMKRHCQELLLEEFEVLDPDVIILQTVQYPEGLWANIKEKFKLDLEFGKNDNTSVFKGTLNGRQVLFVSTYHGASSVFQSKDYIKTYLNPVLDKTIDLLREYNIN